MRLTAAVTHEGEWYVARCLEFDVASQGETVEAARSNLIEAPGLYFEDEVGAEVAESPLIMSLDVAV